jgi:hypothetical protein
MIPRTIFDRVRSGWFWIAGFLAFFWILVRSGLNPKRFTYPCQQAASPLAATWLIAVTSLFGGGFFLRRYAKLTAGMIAVIGVVWLIGTVPKLPYALINSPPNQLPVWEVENPVSTVFVMDSIPPTAGSLAAGDSTVPDAYLSDPAIDTLLIMMETQEIHLHRTAAQPEGIAGSDNVVIIKGNFQWTSWNTTSTDRVKGLIWQILQHPDGFTGEIIVCDNTQDNGTGINHEDNNSEDTDQSIVDVVNTFSSKGYAVYYLDWRYIWDVVAEEYSFGDMNDGYVYEPDTRVSYPKFRSPSDAYYISMKYGIWNTSSGEYNSEQLCIIDFPVLKAHSMAGSTIAVKNWIGMLTTAYSDERYSGWYNMHYGWFWGSWSLVGRVMEATFPRLTIVDAAWTTLRGPIDLYWVLNTKMLFASTDPAAVSWYSAKFVLTPIAYDPNNTDPDRSGSDYRDALTTWTNYLRDQGLPCTKDSTEISVYDRAVLGPTSAGDGARVPPVAKAFHLRQNRPNPFNPQTTISFELPQPARLKLRIFDVKGRLVKSFANGELWREGTHSVTWDGRNDLGQDVGSGIYLYQLTADDRDETRKMLLVR